MPQLSDDPVIDFMLVEAMATKANKEQAEAAKEKERADWRGPAARKEWAKEQGLI